MIKTIDTSIVNTTDFEATAKLRLLLNPTLNYQSDYFSLSLNPSIYFPLGFNDGDSLVDPISENNIDMTSDIRWDVKSIAKINVSKTVGFEFNVRYHHDSRPPIDLFPIDVGGKAFEATVANSHFFSKITFTYKFI